MSLKINIGSNDSFLGYQQEIDNIVEEVSAGLINSIVDAEKRKFSLNSTIPNTKLQFNFNGFNTFIGAGFTVKEVITNSQTMLNSFFILDFYDTFDPNTQQKIFTTYLTKVGYIPNYNISASTSNQLYYWYIPISYTTVQTGSTAIGYVKFSFYNAKSGITTQFYNQYNSSLTTAEKMYFKCELNLLDKTWRFLNMPNSVVIANELTNSILYNDKINNTYNTFNKTIQVFPTGNSYNYVDNKYRLIT